MFKLARIRIGPALALPALLASCATLSPSYSIEIENSSGQDIRDASVYWGRFESVGGSLGPGASASHHFIDLPLPSQLAIRWRTPDKVLHRETVRVPSTLPRRFYGELIFGIFRDGHIDLRVDNEAGVQIFPTRPDPAFERYRSALFCAAQGRIEGVRKALDEGVPGEWEGQGAQSLLEAASLNNRPGVVEYLVTRPGLTFSTWRVANAVRFAAQVDEVEVLQVLLPRLRKEDLGGDHWREALSAACRHGNGSGALYLIRHSHLEVDERLAPFGQNCLSFAVDRGNERLVKLLLAEGADPNAEVLGAPIADRAAEHGFFEIQKLIEEAARPQGSLLPL